MELYRLGNLLNYLSKTLTSKTILKARFPIVTKNSNFLPFLSMFILIFLSFKKMSKKKLRAIQISRHFDYRKYRKETEIIQISRHFLYVYFDFLSLAKMLKDEKTPTFGFNKKSLRHI